MIKDILFATLLVFTTVQPTLAESTLPLRINQLQLQLPNAEEIDRLNLSVDNLFVLYKDGRRIGAWLVDVHDVFGVPADGSAMSFLKKMNKDNPPVYKGDLVIYQSRVMDVDKLHVAHSDTPAFYVEFALRNVDPKIAINGLEVVENE